MSEIIADTRDTTYKSYVTLTLMGDDARAMQTRDLSEGGMFLETATPCDFPLGKMVHVNYLNPL